MSIYFRMSLLWLLIAFCYSQHSLYHLSGLFYGQDIRLPDTNGEVPVSLHLFRIAVEIVTLIICVLTLYIKRKGFYWFCFVWASLLGLLNLVHLAQTVMGEIEDLSQVALLSFVVLINGLLVADAWKMVRARASAIH